MFVCQQCALAAVIIVNLKGMFIQVTDLKKLWYISKYDFVSIVILTTSDASKKYNCFTVLMTDPGEKVIMFESFVLVFWAEQSSGL